MKNKLSIFYTLCGSLSDAEDLASLLLIKNRAVCVNLFKNISSFYKENNKIIKSFETGLIIKTKCSKSVLIDFVIKNHKYEIPFILKIKSQSINKEYLEWAMQIQKNESISKK